MREILFRGKRKDNGEWETGSLLVERMNTSDQRVMIADKMTGYPTLALPETIGQYTGMTDKNGRKIFEGDIVRLFDISVGEIVQECGAFGIGFREPIDYDYLASEIVSITGCNNTPEFCYNDYYVSLYELYWNYNEENDNISVIEVIGNIHDNPELLEVTKSCTTGITKFLAEEAL